eukprot:scaffold653975_cov59-Prasinocladus_malaysianus.AAC.1
MNKPDYDAFTAGAAPTGLMLDVRLYTLQRGGMEDKSFSGRDLSSRVKGPRQPLSLRQEGHCAC